MPVVYPNEAHPADAMIEGLDGTTDVKTGLAYVAKGVGPNSSPTYEVQYNRRLRRQNAVLAAARQGMAVDEGGLKIGVYPIVYMLGGARKTFDGATNQSVPDNGTRKVYLDEANGLQLQTAFPADVTAYLPLATVVTASGTMTITDERPAVMFEVPGIDVNANVVPYSPAVFLAGVLSVKVWEIEWVAPVAFTLASATGRAATGPTGASLIVDIRDNGTSVFASDGDRINIASGANQDTSATVNYAVAAGRVLTFEVKQVGSSTAGSNLTIVLNGKAGLV